ncbi:MAG: SRPBCC family protein [Boseongicola sp.]|nr:SRPBCC family protein [Boseongicola sp.]
MSLIWIVAAVLAVLVIVTLLLVPATSRTTVEIRFDAPIRAVWDVYTDFESQPNWRSDIAKVEMTSDKKSWTEELKTPSMTIRFRILEETRPSKLVLQTGTDGNFEGRYVAEFRHENGCTVGTFTEETTALRIVPKVMRRLFFNQRKFIEEYARQAKAEIERREANADKDLSP